MNENFSESVWEQMFGQFCRSITNIRHQNLTLKSSTDSIVNTFRFAPIWL
jgi:hypothetical protein